MEASMNDAYRRLMVEHNKLKQAYADLKAKHEQCSQPVAPPVAVTQAQEESNA